LAMCAVANGFVHDACYLLACGLRAFVLSHCVSMYVHYCIHCISLMLLTLILSLKRYTEIEGNECFIDRTVRVFICPERMGTMSVTVIGVLSKRHRDGSLLQRLDKSIIN
jgi:hypothetical protein